MTRQLTPYDLIVIHHALLHAFGGMRGITEAGFARLESSAGAPLQSFFGEERYPDLAGKAGALCASIIANHPFSDGNKRVAVAALDILASLNGGTLRADNDGLYALAMAAASGMPREAVVAWAREQISDD